jgi:phosphoglycolate phosphatase
MRVEAVLYDFDHTLVESPLDFAAMRRGVLRVCDIYGVTITDPEHKLVLEIVEEGAGQLDADLASKFRGKADQCVREVERKAALHTRALPGVAESLRRLRAEGRKVAIITRNCREVVETALGSAGLEHDVLLARDDVPRVKPDPEHAAEALARLGVRPEHAVLVGDFAADITCARDAGIPAIGVTTGASSAADLRRAGALVVLDGAAQVPDWLATEGW